MKMILMWIGGFCIGAGITLGVYENYLDTGVKCLERYNTVDEIATCVDILNGG